LKIANPFLAVSRTNCGGYSYHTNGRMVNTNEGKVGAKSGGGAFKRSNFNEKQGKQNPGFVGSGRHAVKTQR
jgi:hypothetical protein